MSWKEQLPRPVKSPGASATYVTRAEAEAMAAQAAAQATRDVLAHMGDLIEEGVSKALKMTPEDIDKELAQLEAEQPFPTIDEMEGNSKDLRNTGKTDAGEQSASEPSKKAMETDEDEESDDEGYGDDEVAESSEKAMKTDDCDCADQENCEC